MAASADEAGWQERENTHLMHSSVESHLEMGKEAKMEMPSQKKAI